MINIKVSGADTFITKLRKDLAGLEYRLNLKYRTLIRHAFTGLVELTPQWSGTLATNWQISTSGSAAKIYKHTPTNWRKQSPVYQRGDDPAVAMTLMREVQKLDAVTIRSKVVFTNPTPYASKVNMGIGPEKSEGIMRPIREENMWDVYGGVAMLGYLDVKYKQLGEGRKILRAT